MRFIVLFFLIVLMKGFVALGQQVPALPSASAVSDSSRNSTAMLMDSVARAMALRERFVADSASMYYLRPVDSVRANKFIQLWLKDNLYTGTGFLDLHLKTKTTLNAGNSRHTRDAWVVGVVLLLLIYTALLNVLLGKDLQTVFQSFYSKRVLSQVSNEDTLLNSWAFIGLFLLFGLTTGLFIYQVTAAYNRYYSITGFQLFITLSVAIIVLFIFKFVVLKFVGFVFEIDKVVSSYISILNLTYFNITFIFLPLTVCFSLLSPAFYPIIIIMALLLAAIVFIWQYIRSSINIISNIRFHKFYLFIYLCALEICPVLILIKALNI